MTPASGDPARSVLVGLAKVGLALRDDAWRRRGRTGLPPAEGELLALLLMVGEGGLAPAELAEALGVSRASAGESVQALEAKRLVRKRREGRTLAVTLTDAGRRAAEEETAWPDLFLAAVGALPAEEQAAVLRGLSTVIRSFLEQGRIPVARMCASCGFFHPHVHADPERPHHCAFVDAPFGEDAR